MRSRWFLAPAAVVVASAAGAACADSEPANDGAPPSETEQPEAGATGDSGSAEPDATTTEPDADAVRTRCSSAGWCVTPLPDADLVMTDIWPVGARAFAIAESPTIGVKVLEWDPGTAAWGYIDDGTQNAPGLGLYAGGIWAPSDGEVFFGVGPGYVFHGTRPIPPATSWTWTRAKLPDGNLAAGVRETAADGQVSQSETELKRPSLGIWGTSRDDVYAWYTNSLFHLESESWVQVYAITDKGSPAERVKFLSGSGSGPDDIWFSGVRSTSTLSQCALVVRKSAGNYVRIADANVSAGCQPKEGYLYIGRLPLTNIHPIAADTAVALLGIGEVVKIARDGTGYTKSSSRVPAAVANQRDFFSLWTSDGDVWLSGRSQIVHGTAIWDGGSYAISTIASDELPLGRPLIQIRGTSTTNLWAIGERYAIHKTTP